MQVGDQRNDSGKGGSTRERVVDKSYLRSRTNFFVLSLYGRGLPWWKTTRITSKEGMGLTFRVRDTGKVSDRV